MIVQPTDAARRRRIGDKPESDTSRARTGSASGAAFAGAAILLALLALGGCGKKGGLYLPGEPPPPPSQSAPEG